MFPRFHGNNRRTHGLHEIRAVSLNYIHVKLQKGNAETKQSRISSLAYSLWRQEEINIYQ